MNKSGFKRVLSVLLTLAMLCGMTAVMGAFPAAAAAEVEKFKANFSELPVGQLAHGKICLHVFPGGTLV